MKTGSSGAIDMPKRKTKTNAIKTAYLHFLDEDAVAAILPLKRVGTWEGSLPAFDTPDSRLDGSCSNCAIVRGIGSTAGYVALEGLLSAEPFEDGTLIGGSQYLPVSAFHERMYEAVIPRLAEVLSRYDRVIARRHDPKKSGRPLGSIGKFAVQFQDDHTWCLPGSVEAEYVIWEVQKADEPEPIAEAAVVNSTGLEEASGPVAQEDAPDAADEATEAPKDAPQQAIEAEPDTPEKSS